MSKGRLTTEEVNALLKNQYVESITHNQIKYTEEFKLLFLKEYYHGKKPQKIFIDSGFDISVMGNKRIERCSARWREANAQGRLGPKYNNNHFYENTKYDNEKRQLERKIKEQHHVIEELKKYIKELEQNKSLAN